MRVARPVNLTEQERQTLEEWAEQADASDPLALRARIVLLADQKRTNKEIAAALDTDRRTAARWRTRFLNQGLPGIESNAPRVPRTPAPRDVMAPLIIETTLNVPPPNARQWSTRSLASILGVSRSMVDRVWRSNGINPRTLGSANTPPRTPSRKQSSLQAG